MKEFRSIDKALAYLIQEYGINILTDSRRCINMLSDIIPDQKSDINLIKYVFECNLISTLISANSRNNSAKQQAINQLNHELVHRSKINESTSSEICSVFVSALGWNVVIPNDIEKEKRRKEKKEKRKTRRKDFIKWIIKHIKVISIIVAAAIIITVAYSKIKPWYEHRGKIHYTNPDHIYVDQDYNKVYSEFSSIGFTNIRTEKINDISELPSDKLNRVESVTINDKKLENDEWLSPDTLIVIRYHSTTDDYNVHIPYSYRDLVNGDAYTILNKLKEAGFDNISENNLEDLELGQLDQIGLIEDFSIDGKTKFNYNDLLPHNTKISISYHDYPLENYIQLPKSLSEYTDLYYEDVEDEFDDLDFTNISTESLKDITEQNDDSIKLHNTARITINQKDEYDKNDMIPVDSEIIIYYHSYDDNYMIPVPHSAISYEGDDCDDVEDELREAGFTNIELKSIKDVIIGVVTKVDEVESISINGDSSFDSDDKFPSNAEIVIKYHKKRW